MFINKLIQAHLLKRSILSIILYPLGRSYSAVQAFRRRWLYKTPYHAPCKVISIGNIVSGGSGKTPLTIALAKMLKDSGLRVGVSHRGYKGDFEHNAHLVSNSSGLLFPAEATGDEAYLIASSLPGIPVVVGRKRAQAIQMLFKIYPATQVIIMDDAFQHLAVHRDLDIVSFAVETGLGNGFVLPAGYLRESLSALTPSTIAVLHRKTIALLNKPLEKAVSLQVGQVFHSYSTVTGCIDPSGFRHQIQSLVGKRIVLVSGIAHPASFEATVKELGLSFSRHFAYSDHYAFDKQDDFESWLREIPDIILCTQKDLMKLARHPEIASRLQAVELQYQFDEPEEFLSRVYRGLEV